MTDHPMRMPLPAWLRCGCWVWCVVLSGLPAARAAENGMSYEGQGSDALSSPAASVDATAEPCASINSEQSSTWPSNPEATAGATGGFSFSWRFRIENWEATSGLRVRFPVEVELSSIFGADLASLSKGKEVRLSLGPQPSAGNAVQMIGKTISTRQGVAFDATRAQLTCIGVDAPPPMPPLNA